jgi:aminobenzoyl-glutamate utilization protein B
VTGLSAEKQVAIDWIGSNREPILHLSDRIWRYAEPALREYKSAREHVDFLREQGFEVETGIAGMPTAFVASFGSGKPTIGFYAEYDATPGNSQKPVPYKDPVTPRAAGFEDTHNGLGTASTAAAAATKAAMEAQGIPGSVKIFGTPAEKLCIGKPYEAREGYYDDLDAAVCWHPWDHNSATWDAGPGCYEVVLFEFDGVAVYGARPWAGVSALDAVTLMNVTVNFLKEHIPRSYTATVNELMTVGGQCPTNLPEYSQIWYAFRASTREAIDDILAMLKRSAEAAAHATGAGQRLRIVSGTRPWLPNHAMAELAYRNLELVGPPQFTEQDKSFARQLQENIGLEPMDEPFDLEITHPSSDITAFHGGADDVNEFAWHTPTCWIHVTYAFRAPGNFNVPSWSTAALARTNVAHQTVLTAAKAMALTATELLTNPSELQKAQAEYQERTKEGSMPVALPPDVQPPIDAIYSFPPYYPEGWQPPTDVG